MNSTEILEYLFTKRERTDRLFLTQIELDRHLTTFGLSCVFFVLLYILIQVIMDTCNPHFYSRVKDSRTEQRNIVGLLSANVHHLGVTLAAVWVLFLMPPQDHWLSFLLYPTADHLDYYPFTTHVAMFSYGYLFTDLLMIVFIIRDFSPFGI